MPLVEIFNPESDEGEWIFWKNDPETQAPVRFLIRRIPPHIAKKFLRKNANSVSVAKLEKQSLADAVDRGTDIYAQRAAFALLDSKNFAVIAKDDETARAYTEILKPEAPFTAGAVVTFDGKWPKPPTAERPWEADKLRGHILEAWPLLSTWIAKKSDELSKSEADEEADLGKT